MLRQVSAEAHAKEAPAADPEGRGLSPIERLVRRPLIPTVAAPACVSCASVERTLEATGYDYEYETCGNPWTMWRCAGCAHLQLDPRPADEALATIYPPDYYSYRMTETVSPIALWAKRQIDALKFASIRQAVGSKPESYLDVGCGDGRYLELMIRDGLARDRVFGLELDDAAVAKARAKGLKVECSRVEDARHLQPGSIDLVTMFHVIEHVARPDEVVASLAALLSPGGCLAIETPNFESMDARMYRRSFWGGYHFPRHWHVFSVRSLTALLERAGLTVEVVRFQTGHAFWLFSFHHRLRFDAAHPRPGFAKRVHPFKSLPLLAVFTAFDMLRAAFGCKTSAMLLIARKPK
jgi:SAM-dependent methyltransferase